MLLSGYWESLLQQLKAHMARTRLRERHQDELRRKLFRLKQEARHSLLLLNTLCLLYNVKSMFVVNLAFKKFKRSFLCCTLCLLL